MELPETMTMLQLTPAQVEQITGVPKRRINEMAERGIVPSEKVGGGTKKVRRSFAVADLELIKEQYQLNYPHRRTPRSMKNEARINNIEQVVSELVDRVNSLLHELGQSDPVRDFPVEGSESPSGESGE